MKQSMLCSVCGKRMLDIDVEGKAEVEVKCPQCRKIITIIINNKAGSK